MSIIILATITTTQENK
ncbi:hypothetical protein [Escherichia coli]|nr:hypothetical protein [Escherichia coli]